MTLDRLNRPALVLYHTSQQRLPAAAHERHFEPADGGFTYRLVVSFEPRSGPAGIFDRTLVRLAAARALRRTLDNLAAAAPTRRVGVGTLSARWPGRSRSAAGRRAPSARAGGSCRSPGRGTRRGRGRRSRARSPARPSPSRSPIEGAAGTPIPFPLRPWRREPEVVQPPAGRGEHDQPSGAGRERVRPEDELGGAVAVEVGGDDLGRERLRGASRVVEAPESPAGRADGVDEAVGNGGDDLRPGVTGDVDDRRRGDPRRRVPVSGGPHGRLARQRWLREARVPRARTGSRRRVRRRAP